MTFNTELWNGQAPGYAAIDRSVRFNSSDSAYLSRTPASAGNRKTWTWAGWVKRSQLGIDYIFTTTDVGASAAGYIWFANDVLAYWDATNAGAGNILLTNAVFRDPSAWYHIVLAVNYSAAVAADRAKFYVNGIEQSYSSTNYPLTTEDSYFNDTTAHYIAGGSERFNGYLADIHFIDGQALDPTSFGEFDTNGIWQPIEYTGTYPGNSFHLDFSDNSSAAALGTDTSGNSNTWTVNNISVSPYVNYASYLVTPVNPTNPFTASYLSTYVNSSGTILATNWVGAYIAGSAAVTWTPSAAIAVASTLDVYGGAYDNIATAFTITVTYTDATTDVFNGTSGNNNWAARYSSAPAGKSIQKIEVTSTSYPQLCAVRVDGQLLVSNLEGPDSLVDVPTNGTETDTGVGGEVRGNYCTWNPLDLKGTTLSNGNLQAAGSDSFGAVTGTIAVSSGKWFWEVTAGSGYDMVGIWSTTSNATSYPGAVAGSHGWYGQGGLYGAGAGSDPGTFTTGDVIGVALDCDAGTLTYYKNGVSLGTRFTGLSGAYRPAARAGHASGASTATYINAGQRPFAYTAPSGFKALCTTNLPSTTITTSGSYIGNGSSDGPFVYLNGVPTAMTVGGNSVTFGTDADKLSNGFKIRTTSTTYNQNASTYNYSITSTGDPFKTARAQSNP